MAKQAAQVEAAGTHGTQTYSDFTNLLAQEFKPKTEQAREAVEFAVRTLAEQALQQSITISDDAYKSIEAIIAEIDHKLSQQINLIVHHGDFQKLESAWRGLHHLVSNSETDEKLKIRFMDISKDELRRTMKRYKGAAWDQSPLFKQIYEEEYGQLGGEPYGCLVADYYFDHTPPDVDLLGSIAKVSAASHTPFITGASPSVLQMESWQELANPRDLTKIFAQNLEYAPWNSLRNTEDARYIGLAMPRFLSRLPYGAKTNPVDEFDFEEDTNGSDHRHYAWANAAYAMGVNINRSFKLYGWCTLIRGVESGGTVENLPCHSFPTDDGGIDMKCPTEIAISDRREAELAPFVDTAARPWRYKTLPGATEPVQGPDLLPFQKAKAIRDVFFTDPGQKKLSWKAEIKIPELDPTITGLVLDIDGQSEQYQHGPDRPFAVTWPGPRGGVHAELTANPRIRPDTSTLSTDGPWAFMRLLRKGRLIETATSGRTRAEFDFDGRKAVLDIVGTGSVANPLTSDVLRSFQCPSSMPSFNLPDSGPPVGLPSALPAAVPAVRAQADTDRPTLHIDEEPALIEQAPQATAPLQVKPKLKEMPSHDDWARAN